MTITRSFRRIISIAAIAAGVCTTASAFPIIDPNPPKTVREYFNNYSRHYVLLSNPAEIAAVDAGAAGPGWVATGYSFTARSELDAPANVCRFYASAPTNAHFFTANPDECAALRTNPGYIFEGKDFSIYPPQGDGCLAYLAPIYRLYNERAPVGERTHRYIHDPSTRADMLAAGWRDEGIAFCSPGVVRSERKSFRIETEQVRPGTECEDESINLGSCVALNQLPRLDNKIDSWLAPSYVTKGPFYNGAFTELTGFDGNVFTAQHAADTAAIVHHSFAQTLPIAKSTFGIHLNTVDRSGDLASINPLYQFRTTAPAANGPDERQFPWLYPLENEIVVSFSIDIRTVRRRTADMHVYGHPTLQFRDTASGQNLAVTLGTYGSGVPGTPGDLLAMDATTGGVIVGTAFRDDPLFGKRLAGSFMRCDLTGRGLGGCGSGTFAFRITRDDFAKVLGLARTLNPRLSDDPTRYLLVNFNFNNVIYREAELGLTLSNYTLGVYGY